MKEIFWVEESSEKPPVCKKRKRRVGKRRLEFIEWGSRPLIEFLEAIGEDTSNKHSRHEVAAFIAKYINDNALASAQKKKKVLCDERLLALFGKKSFSRIKVYDLLEEHFAENHDDSDDDLDSSDEEGYIENKSNASGRVKKVPQTPKSCFAAVVPENIKLVYLRKKLILELLKVPESFECKIMGSFVRMKCDPNDIYQKNRFQLQQVTGVEKVSDAGNADNEIHLKVSNYFKDVPISMLSDDNFYEEELEDLRDRIKTGLLKRLTVIDLELKAQMLHVDITKHSIAKELALLKNQIEFANEKGRRKELFEFLDRRKILQTPSEVEQMLLKVPEVIAEELEPEGTVANDPSEKAAEGSGNSPTSILRESSNLSSTDASGSGEFVSLPQVTFNDSLDLNVLNGGTDGVFPVKNPSEDQPVVDFIIEKGIMQSTTTTTDVMYDGSNSRLKMSVMNSWEKESPREKPEQPIDTTHVIDLSSDDDEPEGGEPTKHDEDGRWDPDEAAWNYMDPYGQTQGPFSLYSLKRWYDANYFHTGFTIWRSDQPSGNGVLLVDVLARIFPSW